MELLSTYFSRLKQRPAWRWRGQVLEALGQTIESSGPLCSVGECCEIIDGAGIRHLVEVIGFHGTNVVSMPVETSEGIRYGDSVEGLGSTPQLEVGAALIGRVLNALGQPMDGRPRPALRTTVPLEGAPPQPLDRTPIRTPLGTGIRAILSLIHI